jgi:hypothetical protein
MFTIVNYGSPKVQQEPKEENPPPREAQENQRRNKEARPLNFKTAHYLLRAYLWRGELEMTVMDRACVGRTGTHEALMKARFL